MAAEATDEFTHAEEVLVMQLSILEAAISPILAAIQRATHVDSKNKLIEDLNEPFRIFKESVPAINNTSIPDEERLDRVKDFFLMARIDRSNVDRFLSSIQDLYDLYDDLKLPPEMELQAKKALRRAGKQAEVRQVIAETAGAQVFQNPEFRAVEKRCRVCGVGGKLQTCARCKGEYYCGPACQRQDWQRHKKVCVPAQEPPTNRVHGPASKGGSRRRRTNRRKTNLKPVYA